MKSLFFVTLLSLTTSAFAFQDQTVCDNPIKLTDNELVCSRQLAQVLAKGNKLVKLQPKQVKFSTPEHMAWGFPDADTSVVFVYYNGITDSRGNPIGVQEISGIVNTEAGWRTKLVAYYTLRGKVLGAFAKEF